MGPLQRFKTPLNISSLVAFAAALSIYWVTADPDVSYWDCPEYVAVASRMEVGHPPGNPIWMLAMRVATMPFPAEHHAFVINLCSGLFMAFTVFFLCRLIFLPLRLSFYSKRLRSLGLSVHSDIMASFIAVGASLCFAFCDSAWFSAVEAEVYAMSAFLAASSLWILMLWWWEKDSAKRFRLLVLLAYISGISLGVHQLNLLLIPVFTLAIFYRSNPQRTNPLRAFCIFLISVLAIAIILLIFQPAMLFGAKITEIWAVNKLGLPYNSGVLIFAASFSLILIVALAILSFLGQNRRAMLPIWCVSALWLGLSSFGMIMIRAAAAPPMNEGVPDNIFALSDYIQRKQYPSSPLFYGHTPYSQPLFREDFIDGKPRYNHYLLKKEEPVYVKFLPEAHLNHRSGMVTPQDSAENIQVIDQAYGYLLEDYRFSQQLTPELNMWLPRITSRNISDRKAYADWAVMTEQSMTRVPVSSTVDSLGNYSPKLYHSGSRPQTYSYKPTYSQNLRFFIAYQAYYMYFRYLFWNFIGRQNDFHSTGEIEHGNFITGIPFMDSYLGSSKRMPGEIGENNPGRNRYFGIPFILGLIGLLFLCFGSRHKRRLNSLIATLFFMTGLAIVAYLNQSPGEPRERDYTFIVSYFAFAVWIAAGLLALAKVIVRFMPGKVSLVLIPLLSISPATLMALENFDDHDRRGRYQTSFFASSILDFETPSIIFSHGDNTTFPLWYSQEVLGNGQEHTTVDITYLSQPSYVMNLKKQGRKGLETIARASDIGLNAYALTKIPHDSVSHPLPLKEALESLYLIKEGMPEFPSSKIIIPGRGNDSIIVNLRDFTRGSSYLSFRHLMLLDIIASQLEASQPKAIYFPSRISFDFYRPLDKVLKPALFGKIYAPWLTDSLVTEKLKESIHREMIKLKALDKKTRYMDPVLADQTRRYRGEMIIAAQELFQGGDTLSAITVVDALHSRFPYQALLPGDFTMADSTFYEGKAYGDLLLSLYSATGNEVFRQRAESIDSLMKARHREWIIYYNSLSPRQRSTLSNRSRRLLL